jgi:transcriptional regulator of arginine metabolism
MKRARQQALLELVRAESLASQDEIAARLERLGFPATQSTISRDLDELGLVRVRDAGGHLRYATPDAGGSNGARHVRALLREFARSVDHSRNLVLVKTPPAGAMPVARALDASDVDGILGTVAGDDTIIVVIREDVRARDVAASLREMAGLS